MSEMDIDNMPAGREMDTLVAVRIEGYVQWNRGGPLGCILLLPDDSDVPDYWKVDWEVGSSRRDVTHVPSYSVRIEEAWRIVEKLLSQYQFSLLDVSARGTLWQCSLEDRGGGMRFPIDTPRSGDVSANAETPALAICRAALKAILEKSTGE